MDIRSHRKCQNNSVIYFLKCSSYNYSVTYIGKRFDLRSGMNNHVTCCRLGGSKEKLDNHVFYCMQIQKKEPFFQIVTFMKLADKLKLLFYKNLSINYD